METRLIPISAKEPDENIILEVTDILQSGGLVAFPTETVYGLGADVLDPRAVEKVFEAKGRPTDNPLIVHIAFIDQLHELGKEISPVALTLADAFWPGPLTLVVKHNSVVPGIVTAGLDTIAVRMPDHAIPLSLVKHLKHGIVGPSANRSGRPSPTTAQHVYDDLNGKIEIILDSGPTCIGVESTVVDTTTNPPTILRPGGITLEQLQQLIGDIQLSHDSEALKRSPGTRHRHYAPRAQVMLIEPHNKEHFVSTLSEAVRNKKKVKSLVYSPNLIAEAGHDSFHALPEDIEKYAHCLFDEIRAIDKPGVDIILVEGVPETGLGYAIMDRLRRASEDS